MKSRPIPKFLRFFPNLLKSKLLDQVTAQLFCLRQLLTRSISFLLFHKVQSSFEQTDLFSACNDLAFSCYCFILSLKLSGTESFGLNRIERVCLSGPGLRILHPAPFISSTNSICFRKQGAMFKNFVFLFSPTHCLNIFSNTFLVTALFAYL